MEPIISEPQIKFKPRLKLFKFGLWYFEISRIIFVKVDDEVKVGWKLIPKIKDDLQIGSTVKFNGTHCTSGSTELMFSGKHCASGSRELMFSGTHCTSGSRELKTVYPPKFQFYLGNMSLSRGVLTTQQRMSPNNLTSLLELYIYLNPLKHYHYLLN